MGIWITEKRKQTQLGCFHKENLYTRESLRWEGGDRWKSNGNDLDSHYSFRSFPLASGSRGLISHHYSSQQTSYYFSKLKLLKCQSFFFFFFLRMKIWSAFTVLTLLFFSASKGQFKCLSLHSSFLHTGSL